MHAANGDYEEPVPSFLTFESGFIRACTNISTVSDLTYEEDEVFSVILSPTQTPVAVFSSSSTVFIVDDDSESKLLCV